MSVSALSSLLPKVKEEPLRCTKGLFTGNADHLISDYIHRDILYRSSEAA